MDAPAKDPGVPLTLKDMRKQRAQQMGMRFFSFVGIPVLLAALYFVFFASDQFESVSPFTVQSAEGQGAMGLESLIGVVPGAGSSRDAYSVREYILSRDVLRKLDTDHQWIAHYQSNEADWLSRLPADATFEEAFEYYQDKVAVHYDSMSGVLTLQVRAFSSTAAQAFAQAILGYSEVMVNDLADRARKDSVSFAKQQVQQAETRLGRARRTVLELQGEGAELNPEQSAAAALTIRSELEGELARARAELSQARAFMRRDAPKVIALAQRVQSLQQQIKRQSRRLIDPEAGKGMHTALAKFESAFLEKEFSQAAYASALKALELALAEAGRQHRYLATIAAPSLPDEATYPRRAYGVLTVFAVALAAFAVGSLLVAAVREHARI